MRLTIELTQGDPKTYTTEFKPSIVTPDRPIDGLYPDSGWLQSLPFDTAKFLALHIRQAPGGRQDRNEAPADPVRQVDQEQNTFRDSERTWPET